MLTELLAADRITQANLAAHLDGLSQAGRVEECRALSGALLRRLWQVCAAAPVFTFDDLVPPTLAGGDSVVYAGKSSLALFARFEKRFCRRDGALIGCNRQAMSWATGPGYFTVSVSDRAGELLLDYTRVPGRAPDGWPEARSNAAGFSWFVYRGLKDYCRRVSRDVIVGSATRSGRELNAYFVLARSQSSG